MTLAHVPGYKWFVPVPMAHPGYEMTITYYYPMVPSEPWLSEA
jgi:hypothetical protein